MSRKYIPLDVLLSQPLVRILRALRRFSWVDVGDLMEALDVASTDVDGLQSRERNAISVAMRRALSRGWVEKRPTRRHSMRYVSSGRNAYDVHITNSGRAWLAKKLAPDMRAEWAPARPGTEHLLCV